jgi:hypothetical protein
MNLNMMLASFINAVQFLILVLVITSSTGREVIYTSDNLTPMTQRSVFIPLDGKYLFATVKNAPQSPWEQFMGSNKPYSKYDITNIGLSLGYLKPVVDFEFRLLAKANNEM